MDKAEIYTVIRESLANIQGQEEGHRPTPLELPENAPLANYGIDEVGLSELVEDLERRFGKGKLNIRGFFNPHEFFSLTFGRLVEQIESDLSLKIKDPVVVYVDDEEENLFVFKRRLGRQLNLKLFTRPKEALEYIRSSGQVGLVITDEVMPGLSGNDLCNEVKKIHPSMKFILITGNPENDTDLLHKTLRGNRFYEFINKPLDLENKGEEYLRLIKAAMAS